MNYRFLVGVGGLVFGISQIALAQQPFEFLFASKKAKCVEDNWKNVQSAKAVVLRVSDGDTAQVVIRDAHYSIRFLGIDTPETNYNGKAQKKWGQEASEELAWMLPPDTQITVEFDEDHCDQYGRMLGHLWKGEENINLSMLRSGLAVNYCIWPNLKHCQEYGQVVDQNMADNLPMFADPSFEIPYEWRVRVGKRPHTKYVGDITDYEVYEPGLNDLVEVGRRVFFFSQSDIHSPYHLVEAF